MILKLTNCLFAFIACIGYASHTEEGAKRPLTQTPRYTYIHSLEDSTLFQKHRTEPTPEPKVTDTVALQSAIRADLNISSITRADTVKIHNKPFANWPLLSSLPHFTGGAFPENAIRLNKDIRLSLQPLTGSSTTASISTRVHALQGIHYQVLRSTCDSDDMNVELLKNLEQYGLLPLQQETLPHQILYLAQERSLLKNLRLSSDLHSFYQGLLLYSYDGAPHIYYGLLCAQTTQKEGTQDAVVHDINELSISASNAYRSIMRQQITTTNPALQNLLRKFEKKL